MKTYLSIFFVALAATMIVGCSGGQTSQGDINEAAKVLQDKAAGTPIIPEEAVVNRNGGGGPATAPKPGK